MRAHTRRTRYGTIAGLALTALLIASCQSTTSETTSGDDDASAVYPGTEDSPGLTDDSITIALPGGSNADSPTWASNGPVYLALEELVERYNSRGGIAEHAVLPIWGNDALSGSETTADEVVRRVCAASVGQEPSFARQAASFSENIDSLERHGCIGEKRTINFISDRMVSAGLLASSPDVVAPNALDDVTAAHVLVDRLQEQGFFDDAGRVAVLSPSGKYPEGAETVVTDLEALGVSNPLAFVGEAGADLAIASVKSQVLQLKTAKVDRIVYFDDFLHEVNFITAMTAQNYTPPIATLSSAYPDAMAVNGYPAEQVFAVSWFEGFTIREDVVGTMATVPETPASRACIELSESTGTKLAAGSEERLLSGCDTLVLLDEAFNASGADRPTTTEFFNGIAKLSDFDSAYGLTLDFSHGRAGAAQVWDLTGDSVCNCLSVTGGPFPVDRE